MFERVKGLNARCNGRHFLGSAPDIQVNSDCYFWLDVHAASATAAIEAATTRILPSFQTAMSLQMDHPKVMLEVLWATNFKASVTGWSNSVAVGQWGQREFTPETYAGIKNDFDAIQGDKAAAGAARYLSTAIVKDVTASDDESRNAAMLASFKVIESLATALPLETPADKEEKESAIVSRLAAALGRTKHTAKKIEALRRAGRELAEFERRYLGLRIKDAGRLLGLSADWTSQALKFNEMRNKFSHPRLQGTTGAHRLARSHIDIALEMLRAYVDALASKA